MDIAIAIRPGSGMNLIHDSILERLWYIYSSLIILPFKRKTPVNYFVKTEFGLQSGDRWIWLKQSMQHAIIVVQ